MPPTEASTLLVQGNDDWAVPIGASALLASKLIRNTRIDICMRAADGTCWLLKSKADFELYSIPSLGRSSGRD